ncbi:MAG: ribosomal RNA small subunit methyltransferase A [Candidatus Wolframiiraptor sp. EX4484-121]|nr:MAG: ribosomal RNA small subunit methyltransferase A [Candidatus Wolframiiraptor sp. EX4484-121]
MRKRLGQHFLIDEKILDRMVQYGEIAESDVVLDVGAGRGELTAKLAERAGKVIAVELDPELAEEARRRLRGYGNVELLVGDVLKLKPTGFNKVVSNPPYNISRKLLEWLIDGGVERIVLTLQREFASKLVAEPGSMKYLYISFLSNLLYDSSIVEFIPRNMFRPMPKVDSAIILMKRRRDARELGEDSKELIKFLFTRRRQVLRRVLRDLAGKRGLAADLSEIFGDELLSRRIYQLTPSQLLSISEKFLSLKAK